MKTCCIENCKNKCEPNRRYCRKHYLERKIQQAKIRFEKSGRYMFDCVCCVCGKQFRGFRKGSVFCSWKCYAKYRRITMSDSDSKYTTSAYRRLAESLLGPLGYDAIVHHIDLNKANNTVDNLLVISRKTHVHLHIHLNAKKLGYMKYNIPIDEWKNMLWPITKQWLLTWNKPYIRLDQIGDDSHEILKKISPE